MQPELKIDHELAQRAIGAYARKCLREGLVLQQPTRPEMWRRHDGTRFIALANTHGLLALYRLRSDGRRIAEVRDVPAAIRRAYG